MATIAKPEGRTRIVERVIAQPLSAWAEATWLSAIVLVPLLFGFNATTLAFEEPKRYALHFFALILLGMLTWTGVVRATAMLQRSGDRNSADIWPWIKKDPANALLAVTGLFMFAYILSTLLSPVPVFSFLGVDPKSTGYNLYTFLSFMIIMTAIVIYVTEIEQVWRIIYAIAFTGTLSGIYGVLQSNNWDMIGVVDHQIRVLSSFGNPIYFGAYLVITIPITASLIGHSWIKNIWLRSMLISTALSVQVLSLWLTGSRGPLTGFGAALLVAGLTMTVLWSWRQFDKELIGAIAIMALGPIITMAVVAPTGGVYSRSIEFSGELNAAVSQLDESPSAVSTVDEIPDEPVPAGSESESHQLTGISAVPLDNWFGGSIDAGLGGRADIWTDVVELSTSWERLQPDTGVSKLLRPLFGYGPDMLRYSTPLASDPRASMQVVDHAHNRYLQFLGELGWVGLTLFIAVMATVTWMLVVLLYRIRSGRITKHLAVAALAVGLVAAIAGNSFEQLTGIGRISDLLAFWVLIAVAISFFKITTEKHLENTTNANEKSTNKNKRNARQSRTTAVDTRAPAVIATAIVALLAIVLFYSIDIANLRASMLGVKGISDPRASAGFITLREARNLAPNYEDLVVASASRLVEESRLHMDAGDRDSAIVVIEEARRELLDFHERNPLALPTRVMLANVAARRVELGIEDSPGEMVAAFEDLAKQFPNEGGLLGSVAAVYLLVGRNDEALELANRSIAIEQTTRAISQGWWVRGNVLFQRGELREAGIAYLTAIFRNPISRTAVDSHTKLAEAYESVGDLEAAESHRQQAAETEEELLSRL